MGAETAPVQDHPTRIRSRSSRSFLAGISPAIASCRRIPSAAAMRTASHGNARSSSQPALHCVAQCHRPKNQGPSAKTNHGLRHGRQGAQIWMRQIRHHLRIPRPAAANANKITSGTEITTAQGLAGTATVAARDIPSWHGRPKTAPTRTRPAPPRHRAAINRSISRRPARIARATPPAPTEPIRPDRPTTTYLEPAAAAAKGTHPSAQHKAPATLTSPEADHNLAHLGGLPPSRPAPSPRAGYSFRLLCRQPQRQRRYFSPAHPLPPPPQPYLAAATPLPLHRRAVRLAVP